jgi:hypothetical protein
LKAFTTKFGGRFLHEVTSLEISDWAAGQGWSKRTKNDALGTVSLLYGEAIDRSHVATNPARSEAVKREKLRGGSIGIFSPVEARKILHSIDECLRPFLALWMFGGARKEEASRIKTASNCRAAGSSLNFRPST